MNGSVRTSVVLASLLASAVFAPSAAHAADPASPVSPASAPAESAAAPASKAQAASAKKHLAAGDKLYKAADYAGALTEYQAADTDAPSAEAARGIGQAQEKLGHTADAVAAYERYISLAGPKEKQADLDAAKASIDSLKKSPGKLHVDTDPAGAEVHVDGLDTAYKGPFDVDLAPGSHTLHATAEGKSPADQTVDVTYAGTTSTTIKLSPLPVPPPTPVAAPPVSPVQPAPGTPPPQPLVQTRTLVPAYVTGALAIVSAGVGIGFGIAALHDKSVFDNNPTSSRADDGESHALVADMAFGIAVSLGVTSAILFLSHDDPPTASSIGGGSTTKTAKATETRPVYKPTFNLAPVVTPHGGGAGALVTF